MKKVELLSPAGNLTKLKIALEYGADAVYASMGNFSLRQRSAKEFDLESFSEGVKLTHEKGKKFYATVNGFPFNMQIEGIKKHIQTLKELEVDAMIIATPGVMALAKEIAPQIEIHLSTQANVMNYLDAKIYHQMGASRIVAAREMSLKDAIKIKEMVPNLEIEIFVHGSMCFAYSGRCLVSAVQSGRFSNRGSCANDCRFNYELYAKSPENGALFRLEENEGGTYIMNSKDLNLGTHIEKIMQTDAIDSFKIEGRTKSEYYVACATRAYRMAIDDAMAGKFDPSKYEKELNSLANRGFTDGYLIHKPYERKSTQSLDIQMEDGTHQVHAISEDGEVFKTKHRIDLNTPYEIVAPLNSQICEVENEIGRVYSQNGLNLIEFKKLTTKTGKEFSDIHSGNLNEIILPVKLPNFTFLRKEI
ncbi:peptidase U32 family protein [Campylobacter geochelonis]|uniref:Putative protease n=1 Tax=Campylobacter geochelonis TaxID=1780362 RepID=A0A128EQ46_9BACT|nr:peptidase U32 family protein [Campylobacter geochelonis]QKF70922.1 collagenase-like peptidase, U32 family [Campylobacter geochelonis]CZE46968.1 putative protease [Campylobacter geochelonis]CZE49067.1 putative protease [Campylobacter geochelonis]CZE51231.1 putative protease [Campylobacter geochelonis]